MRSILRVFVSGGTGYIGKRLIRLLVDRGHAVSALARASSAKKLPLGCTPVIGDALNATTFAGQVAGADTFVHLVGVSHPAPWKEQEFRAVDLAAVKASVDAAIQARVQHFVYVSVAQPAPGNEGLHPSTRRMRRHYRQVGLENHIRAAVVCAGARALVAGCTYPLLSAAGTDTE
jgi:uncharacterized protein YbjT (DUF2867 family)